MAKARSLIDVFYELNASSDKTVAHFTPALIGMFGSIGIFDTFLKDIDSAIASGQVPVSLKKRAANLSSAFIPQVAEYNSIKNLETLTTSVEDLRAIKADSLENRRKGVETILSALITILKETEQVG